MAFRSAFFVLVSASFAAGCSATGGGTKVGDDGADGVTGGATGSGGTSNIPGTGGSGAVVDPGMPPDAGADCDSVLEVTYRDFAVHPDFEMAFRGDVVRRGLVAPTLGADQKPTFLNDVGCPAEPMTPLACANWTVTTPTLTTTEAFAQWYNDVPDVNLTFEKQLELTETPPGSGEYTFDSASFFPLEPAEGFGVSPAGHYTGKN